MPKVKLNFRNLSIPEKLARARQVLAAMTNNARFPNPHPDLSELGAAIAELEAAADAAQAARLAAKQRTAALSQREDDVDGFMSQMAAYVESVAGDDESVIYSAGLEPRGAATPASGAPEAPDSLTATVGDHDGEIDLSWDTVRGARSYVIELTTNPQEASAWKLAGVSPRSSFVVEGLASGTRYYFRVAAVTLNGQSPWSNPAIKIAP
ncbi:MAG TPA: fibronectin type III domain-containing protein [Pyrinomonadaceae bacterium]|nr:fibronectin type III domain-containing protein [Pyrinomonadaceae bacterium]